MILPVYAALERIPHSLLEASRDLGGNGRRTLWSVILPLALPGVVAGSIFTFSLTLGDYITPLLVGGASSQFIGNVVYAASTAVANNCRSPRRTPPCPLAIMAHLPVDRAQARRVRGALMESTAAPGRAARLVALVLLFLYVPLVIICSTRSTNRTCRAGRCPGSRRSGSPVASMTTQVRRRSGCRCKAGLLAATLVRSSSARWRRSRVAPLPVLRPRG